MQQPRFTTVQEYGPRFTDVEYWQPYVQAVCTRHRLGPCADIQAGLPGTFPVFLIDGRNVVKLFGDLFDGPRRFAVEYNCYGLLAAHPEFPAPRLVDCGVLFPHSAAWQWPYLITTLIPGTSLGTASEQVSAGDKAALVGLLGRLVRRLHGLPIDALPALAPGWDNFVAFFRERRAACAADHRRWQALPDRLVEQIEAYIPPTEELIDQRINPHLLHCDLNEDHVLGEFAGGHWDLTGIIDFGDAMIGDPIYELVALHIGLNHCDKRLLRIFLDEYAAGPELHERFALRAMSYTLLHEFAVLRQVFDEYPAARDVQSLDELALLLWDTEHPGLT